MIPTGVFLTVFFWILLSALKYWYYTRANYNYGHKLNAKTLAEIRRPPEHVLEKIRKKQSNRKEKVFLDEPEDDFQFKDNDKSSASKNFSGKGNGWNKSSNGSEKRKGRSTRPLTLIEEMELLQQKQTKLKKKNGSKHDRGMFDDPLSRLYSEIEELKQQQSTSHSKK